MTANKALELKSFASNWITKVVAKRKDYGQRLVDELNWLIPDDIDKHDPYSILDVKNWDETDNYQQNGYNPCMGDLLEDLFGKNRKASCSSFCWLTDKACNDIVCALRIACDLYIEQSGGVVGYTVGDLRKVFDGNIPEEIMSTFEPTLLEAKDSDPIWL